MRQQVSKRSGAFEALLASVALFIGCADNADAPVSPDALPDTTAKGNVNPGQVQESLAEASLPKALQATFSTSTPPLKTSPELLEELRDNIIRLATAGRTENITPREISEVFVNWAKEHSIDRQDVTTLLSHWLTSKNVAVTPWACRAYIELYGDPTDPAVDNESFPLWVAELNSPHIAGLASGYLSVQKVEEQTVVSFELATALTSNGLDDSTVAGGSVTATLKLIPTTPDEGMPQEDKVIASVSGELLPSTPEELFQFYDVELDSTDEPSEIIGVFLNPPEGKRYVVTYEFSTTDADGNGLGSFEITRSINFYFERALKSRPSDDRGKPILDKDRTLELTEKGANYVVFGEQKRQAELDKLDRQKLQQTHQHPLLEKPVPPLKAIAWTKDVTVPGQAVPADTEIDFEGKLTLVIYGGPYCGPCRANISKYASWLTKYGEDGLSIVYVFVESQSDDPDKVRDFDRAAAELAVNPPRLNSPVPYPVVKASTDFMNDFEPPSQPTIYLVDGMALMRRGVKAKNENGSTAKVVWVRAGGFADPEKAIEQRLASTPADISARDETSAQ